MGIIYCAKNILNNKKYIGQTIKSIEERKQKHLNSAFKHNSSNRFHVALRKHGMNIFEWDILKEVNDKNLDNQEIFFINKFDTFNSGYNMTEGGHDLRGYKHSDKTKLKIGKSLKGRSNKDHYIARYGEKEGTKKYDEYILKMRNRKGKTRLEGFIEKYGEVEGNKRYEEFVQKLKKSKTGKKLSEEHKRNIGLGGLGKKMPEKWLKKMIGRKLSEEHKRKIGNAHRGKKVSPESISKRLKTIKLNKQKKELI